MTYVFKSGVHKGQNITDVPTAYLSFLAEKVSGVMGNEAKREINRRCMAIGEAPQYDVAL